MTVVGILWVVLTPYLTGLFVAWSRPVNRLVVRSMPASTAAGWSAIAVLLAGVFAVGGGTGVVMAIASAPLVGLAFWTKRDDPDDGDEPPLAPDDPPPAPDAVARPGVRVRSPRRSRPTGHRPEPQRVRTR